MLLKQEREQVVSYGKKMIASGLTTGTGGNLSVMNRDKGLIAVSPSAVAYNDMTPSQVAVTDISGNLLEGKHKPSSEIHCHTALYEKRADICAAVHTHSVYATTLACLHRELPPVHYLVGFSGKKVPLAPYATFGTKALAKNIAKAIKNYNAVLMANHGLMAVGPDMAAAFNTAEEIEFVARVCFQAECMGKPVLIDDREMEKVIRKFKTYGNPADASPS